ncbi:hypothetical protein AB0M11_18715 [Streptomyces sp. NPDC051987]|uniref:hypothetical protein n=1 Tax=Streptomyces sp. NPDC051987 TaxID=3155808 RepID=UPI0034136CDF
MASGRFEELVSDSLDKDEMDTRCLFALGDAALEIEPLRGHGGHLPIEDEDRLSVEDSLRYIVTEGGLTGQRGYFCRDADGAVVGVDLAGRLFKRVVQTS